MSARRGVARVGACLRGPLDNNPFVYGAFFPFLWGGPFFRIDGLFSPFWGALFHFLDAIFSMRGGGGLFSPYVQNFLGAHALVARVIANMLLW